MKMYFLHFQPAMLVFTGVYYLRGSKKQSIAKNTLELRYKHHVKHHQLFSQPQLPDNCEQLVLTGKKNCEKSPKKSTTSPCWIQQL